MRNDSPPGSFSCPRCGATHYRNDSRELVLGENKTVTVCRTCANECISRLREPDFIAKLCRHSMTFGELAVLNREKAQAYALSDFKKEEP